MAYNDNLWAIDDSLQKAMEQIKVTLQEEHPDGSGDELVKISDGITDIRHMLADMIFKTK